MKKLSNKGFVLAETLIVTIFVLTIFTMIYTNYYPIIGVYEERETYDDVEGKYTAYWIKKLIENESYNIGKIDETLSEEEYKRNTHNKLMMDNYGYIRFECRDMPTDNNKRSLFINLLKDLEISNCDIYGNGCDIFLTHYKIGSPTNKTLSPNFKKTVNGSIPSSELSTPENINGYSNHILKRYEEYSYDGIHLCTSATDNNQKLECKKNAFKDCVTGRGYSVDNVTLVENGEELSYDFISQESANDAEKEVAEYCVEKIQKNVFPSYLIDYINYLPDYSLMNNSTNAKYRVIVVSHHKKALNNYYSFATMEVNK